MRARYSSTQRGFGSKDIALERAEDIFKQEIANSQYVKRRARDGRVELNSLVSRLPGGVLRLGARQ